MSASTSNSPGTDDAAVRLARQYRTILWRVQKMAFWVLYDYAGHMVLLNLLTLAVVFGIPWLLSTLMGGKLLLPGIVAALLGLLAVVGQATLIVALLEEEEFSLRRVWKGVVAHGPKALVLATLFAAAAAVSSTGAWFYLAHVWPYRPLIGSLLAGFCLSAGLAVLLAGVYVLPALVNQRGTALKSLRTSVMLAGKHPVLTPSLLLVMVGQGLLLATPPGLVLLSSLPLVALTCSAYELLSRHHGAAGTSGAVGVGPVFDEDDIFLNRGFKDLLFPWKG